MYVMTDLGIKADVAFFLILAAKNMAGAEVHGYGLGIRD